MKAGISQMDEHSRENDKKQISLNGEWSLYFGSQENGGLTSPTDLANSSWPEITARVPGNVELDLVNAGLLENPEKGRNIYDLQKYESYQWWYSRKFKTPKVEPGERIKLVFEGLDCLGTIWINDTKIGDTDNMLIPHQFDVTDLLNPEKENTLYVRISSAVLAGREYPTAPLEYALPGKWEALNIRKAPHMYGWDIMPRIVSAGLWRNVSLKIENNSHFKSVYWATQSINLNEESAEIFIDWTFKTPESHIQGLQVEVIISKDGISLYKQTYPVTGHHDKQKVSLENVKFWWPKGYGDQPMYNTVVRLLSEDGKELDSYNGNLGIRTIELRRSEITCPDKKGEFGFIVNGTKIFMKGTNWVPLDGFHSRDRQHLDTAIGMLVDLNCNMIRCWGGNVYESQDFYDLCDKNGIMVWQDFTMGCARYPQTDDLAAKMQKEAYAIIPLFRNHPSLALWAGNNENDVALTWIGMNHIDPNTDRISREVLPTAVHELDPFRPYLPSSPYVSPEVFKQGFDKKTMPEVHLWGPRGYFKASFYTDVWAHFVSEIGYHGCPDRASLEQMMDSEYVYPWKEDGSWNEQWEAKAVAAFPSQTEFAQNRNNLMTNQVKHLFGEIPDDLDKFIMASQTVQAEAKKFFIETWRMKKWDRTGILWWNLRDGWPIVSDAIVDYYNRKKLAYLYIQRSQTDVCVMFDEAQNGIHNLIVVNDTRKPVKGKIKVRDIDNNKVLLETEFDLAGNGKKVVDALKDPGNQKMWLIEWQLDNGKTNINHYLVGKPPFSLKKYEKWLGKITLEENIGF